MEAQSTWWKRLLIVIEQGVAGIAVLISCVIMLFDPTVSRWGLFLFIVIPWGAVRLLRAAVVYVVEGKESKSGPDA